MPHVRAYDYDRVAELANEAFDNGDSIGATLAAEYGITESNARRLASTLRKKGYSIPFERQPQRNGNREQLPPLTYDRLMRPEPWKQYGTCATMDPDLFFPARGQSTEPAKAACAVCPCKKACLKYALRAGEKYGIWGGASERERRAMRRKIREQAA